VVITELALCTSNQTLWTIITGAHVCWALLATVEQNFFVGLLIRLLAITLNYYVRSWIHHWQLVWVDMIWTWTLAGAILPFMTILLPRKVMSKVFGIWGPAPFMKRGKLVTY
jgi:hypothetical protein